MAIVLIVEDGTGVADANTYATVAEYRAYAAVRALAISANDDDVAAKLVVSAEYLDSFEAKFQGKRSLPAVQPFAWPRKCVELFDVPLGEFVIPAQLKRAQFAATTAALSGVSLFPSRTGAAIIEETVGPLTTVYDKGTWSDDELPVISGVEIALQPLFEQAGNVGIFVTRRV